MTDRSRAQGAAKGEADGSIEQLPEGLAPEIDPVRFAKERRQLAGTTSIRQMPRLQESGVLDDDLLVHWQISGSTGRDELDRVRQFLSLSLEFSPVLSCARCLGPVDAGMIQTTRRYRLAASERQAALEDPEAGDVEVLAITPRLALAELIEDEAMLALPMAVSHEQCPDAERLN